MYLDKKARIHNGHIEIKLSPSDCDSAFIKKLERTGTTISTSEEALVYNLLPLVEIIISSVPVVAKEVFLRCHGPMDKTLNIQTDHEAGRSQDNVEIKVLALI